MPKITLPDGQEKEFPLNTTLFEVAKNISNSLAKVAVAGKIDGKLRFVKIGNVDFQPCGGTHVKNTREIGEIKIGKIENKGKMNRRVNILIND